MHLVHRKTQEEINRLKRRQTINLLNQLNEFNPDLAKSVKTLHSVLTLSQVNIVDLFSLLCEVFDENGDVRATQAAEDILEQIESLKSND